MCVTLQSLLIPSESVASESVALKPLMDQRNSILLSSPLLQRSTVPTPPHHGSTVQQSAVNKILLKGHT